MNSFNVLKEPWIPVVDAEGNIEELGICSLLRSAHQLKGVCDPAPPVQYGIYRILISFVMDAFNIEGMDDIEEILEAKKFDSSILVNYIEKTGENCFDLFDGKRPFLQSPEHKEWDKNPKSVTYLFQHFPSGTNPVHFNHVYQDEIGLSPSACARGLCTLAPFITSGGQGNPPSINGIPPWYILIRGKSLFETILLNCIGFDYIEGLEKGKPVWCLDPQVEPKKTREQTTLLEGLTWRPRRVRLIPEVGGICSYTGKKSDILIKDMIFTAGHKARIDNWIDPHVPQKITKKGRFCLLPSKEKEIWLDTGPILLLKESDYQHFRNKISFEKPVVVRQYQEMLDIWLEKREIIEVEAYALETDGKMKMEDWRYEKLAVPRRINEIPNSAYIIQEMVDHAETIDYFIGEAVKKGYSEGEVLKNRKIPKNLIGFGKRGFWEALKADFDRILWDIAKGKKNNLNLREEILQKWHEVIKKHGREALEMIISEISSSGDDLIAQVAAREDFNKRLGRLSMNSSGKKQG